MSEYKTLYLSTKDSVAVALSEIPENTSVVVKTGLEELVVSILEPIRFGHKFAVKSIEQGADIIKYGEVIGAASAFIPAGAHVHVHNLEGKRGRGDKIAE
ncbi:UxaA family hydrolase [Peribacillus simplex]|uniref:D-galactarate dehydratase n=2 Tax=Peribacillus simplex TaxID=1478 RepID=A0A223ENP3_9BACI|nr:UxaA family hydrolase [Peribacillus simplex]ASS96824.1 D-galactarate dehydratase [Peribacillus simplex NBRC 15720 = DSM 1321]MEC1395754.1 UxaA family hydrolase [Peribacillus simplex]MED3912025.1 UxaA family hydrolase [Peribacillus simplex]MED3986582.1 UxaA family hydrolase [Peribacillus simplex]MED4096660.1 UxaA family hydrolase [Peribacillus simplex]